MKKPTRVNHPPRVELAPDNHPVVAPIYQTVKFDFDSLGETITRLSLSGDTALAMVDQSTVRQQRVEGEVHEVRTSVTQRESWIKTKDGWMMWRVDSIQPGATLVDGKPLPPRP